MKLCVFVLQVSIKFTPNVTQPGQRVSFNINASPNSKIGILGVDRSVQLLGTGNDITKSEVKEVSFKKIK
jgi:hypothetical protein